MTITGMRRTRLGAGGALLSACLLVAGTLTANSAQADSTTDGGPCDLYNADQATTCVAAYSTTRALSAGYNGPLYQVLRASDEATADIGLLPQGGYADAAAQDSFCENTRCTISAIYDQSGQSNHLTPAWSGSRGALDAAADAAALPVTVDGHKAYGVYMPPRVGYRMQHRQANGLATGDQAESMYEVASGTNFNNQCCSDFGNVEIDSTDDGGGTMDTLNISTYNRKSDSGASPRVQADLENGVYEGYTNKASANTGNDTDFVTATLRNHGANITDEQHGFSLQGGDSQNGNLTTWYDGPLPADHDSDSYSPMRLQGGIGLGAGGDNTNKGAGSFFEGVVTTGYASDATNDKIQANIVDQTYEATGPHGTGNPDRDAIGADNENVTTWNGSLNVNARSYPHITTPSNKNVLTTINPNTRDYAMCQTHGDKVTDGSTSDWWSRLRDHDGWVSNIYLTSDSKAGDGKLQDVAVCPDANTNPAAQD